MNIGRPDSRLLQKAGVLVSGLQVSGPGQVSSLGIRLWGRLGFFRVGLSPVVERRPKPHTKEFYKTVLISMLDVAKTGARVSARQHFAGTVSATACKNHVTSVFLAPRLKMHPCTNKPAGCQGLQV